jgi:hypothetical protein
MGTIISRVTKTAQPPMYTINHLDHSRDDLAQSFFKYNDAVKAAIRNSYDDCTWMIICDNETIAIVHLQSLYELTETPE